MIAGPSGRTVLIQMRLAWVRNFFLHASLAISMINIMEATNVRV